MSWDPGLSAQFITPCVRRSSHKSRTDHNQKENGGIFRRPRLPIGPWLSDDYARVWAAKGANGAENPLITTIALMTLGRLFIIGALPLTITACDKSSRSAPADT